MIYMYSGVYESYPHIRRSSVCHIANQRINLFFSCSSGYAPVSSKATSSYLIAAPHLVYAHGEEVVPAENSSQLCWLVYDLTLSVGLLMKGRVSHETWFARLLLLEYMFGLRLWKKWWAENVTVYENIIWHVNHLKSQQQTQDCS